MRALVIGATGATGKDLVETLVSDASYSEIVLFVRRLSGGQHPKVTEILTDFSAMELVSDAIRGDVLFSCLGTTLKTAGSKENQWQIDYGIPANFATIAKQNGIATVVLLSTYGADSSSKVFYSSMKGKLEEYFMQLSFDRLIIFRPSLLLRKGTDRWGEKVSAVVLKTLNAVGILTKLRPIPTKILAQKLAMVPKTSGRGQQILDLKQILEL